MSFPSSGKNAQIYVDNAVVDITRIGDEFHIVAREMTADIRKKIVIDEAPVIAIFTPEQAQEIVKRIEERQ